MALKLKHSCFLHIPKTGGTSVRQVLKGEETGNEMMPFNRRAHMTLEEARKEWDGPFFTFVRHPFDWYRSYWVHRHTRPWTLWQHHKERRAWDESRHGTFRTWLDRITEYFPGFCSWYFNRYIGTPSDRRSDRVVVGRLEFLEEDLKRILESFGEDVPDEVPVTNVRQIPGLLTEVETRAIESVEYGLLEEYYTASPIQERLELRALLLTESIRR